MSESSGAQERVDHAITPGLTRNFHVTFLPVSCFESLLSYLAKKGTKRRPCLNGSGEAAGLAVVDVGDFDRHRNAVTHHVRNGDPA
jgi:hypothetical protein